MKISRTLLINSPLEFYNFIRDKNHIVDISPILSLFRDNMNLYIHGCSCDKDVNYKKMNQSFQNLTLLDKDITNELKKYGDCQKIVFNSNGVFLFEI